MFDSTFFEEAWPTISRGLESEADAESEVGWILGHVRPPASGRILDAPCGFGRHSLALARRGFDVTGVDLSETELRRAKERAQAAGLPLELVKQDMRDTVRVTNRFDVRTSRIQEDRRLEDQHRLLGQTEIRVYSAHGLLRVLRPERWSQVELFGGLDGRPFVLESPRIVLVATK